MLVVRIGHMGVGVAHRIVLVPMAVRAHWHGGVPMQVVPEDLRHGEINSTLGAPSAYTRAGTAWIDRLAD